MLLEGVEDDDGGFVCECGCVNVFYTIYSDSYVKKLLGGCFLIPLEPLKGGSCLSLMPGFELGSFQVYVFSGVTPAEFCLCGHVCWYGFSSKANPKSTSVESKTHQKIV